MDPAMATLLRRLFPHGIALLAAPRRSRVAPVAYALNCVPIGVRHRGCAPYGQLSAVPGQEHGSAGWRQVAAVTGEKAKVRRASAVRGANLRGYVGREGMPSESFRSLAVHGCTPATRGSGASFQEPSLPLLEAGAGSVRRMSLGMRRPLGMASMSNAWLKPSLPRSQPA